MENDHTQGNPSSTEWLLPYSKTLVNVTMWYDSSVQCKTSQQIAVSVGPGQELKDQNSV